MADLSEFEGLHVIDERLSALVQALSARERHRLMRCLVLDVRRFNHKNITKQRNPDGSAWPARKTQINKGGKIARKKKMMLGLRKARHMRVSNDDQSGEIGYRGRTAQIAWVHQTGGLDAAVAGGDVFRYPVRQLLGFPSELQDLIEDRLLDHLERALS